MGAFLLQKSDYHTVKTLVKFTKNFKSPIDTVFLTSKITV